MFNFCTYFDRNYLPKGLALYDSLERYAAGDFQLFVLCLDDHTYQLLQGMNLKGLYPISMAEFERGDEELVATKDNRSRIEYYFTCTPSIPLYVMRNYPSIDAVTYVDADLFFFANPQPIFDELGDGSVAIIAHRFPDHLQHLVSHGIYNVGLLVFRNDERGLNVLQWWRDRCIEWCYDRVEGDKFADQKYLDRWPEQFEGVVVLEHKGSGLSPWNVERYTIQRRGDHVYVDDDPLVFYHFHGLKRISRRMFESGLGHYGAPMTSGLLRGVYTPYLRVLQPLIERNQKVIGSIRASTRKTRRRDLLKRLMHEQTLVTIGNSVLEIKLK